MDRYEYQELKQSGGLVADAALQDPESGNIDIVEEEETDESQVDQGNDNQEPSDEQSDDQEPLNEEEDDLPPLSDKEKTAFEKRLERERRKLEDQLKEQLKAEYEQQYGKHKAVIDLLGGDPEALERRIRESQMAQEAQRLAEQNGWDKEQTEWYIEQQKKDQRLKELEVQVAINELKDKPDYQGIQTMKEAIINKIRASGGVLSVEEAYWAVGGPKRVEQIKLEAQMREQEKRKQQPRTVLTDAQTTPTTDKPLPSDVMRDAERMGISAAEARRLMSTEPPQSIDEYRKRKAK